MPHHAERLRLFAYGVIALSLVALLPDGLGVLHFIANGPAPDSSSAPIRFDFLLAIFRVPTLLTFAIGGAAAASAAHDLSEAARRLWVGPPTGSRTRGTVLIVIGSVLTLVGLTIGWLPPTQAEGVGRGFGAIYELGRVILVAILLIPAAIVAIIGFVAVRAGVRSQIIQGESRRDAGDEDTTVFRFK